MATIVVFNPFTDELFPMSTTGFDDRFVNVTGDTMTGDLLIQPTVNSATTLQVNQADGTNILTVDTINDRILTNEIRALSASGLKLYDDEGNGIFVEDGGNVGIGTTEPGAKLQVNTGVATTIGQIIKGAAAQTADLQQWRDNLDNVLGSVDASGNFYVADNLSFQFRDAQLYVNSDADGYLDLHADTAIRLDNFYSRASYWWYCKYMDAISLSPGGSGATQVVPTANVIGGYNLDAATEYLYFNGAVCNNWDGESDLEVKIRWQLGVGGANAADTVDLKLVCYYMGNGEATTKTQTLEEAVTVGTAAVNTMFTTTFTIDWDLAGNVVEKGDVFSFRLNLETDTSEVDSVTINFGRFRYRTATKQPIVV